MKSFKRSTHFLISLIFAIAMLAGSVTPSHAATIFELTSCDGTVMQAFLAFMEQGDTLQVTADCSDGNALAGPFTLPAGTTFESTAAPLTITAVNGQTALTVGTSAGLTTTVNNVRIVSDGDAGILFSGTGAAALSAVTVEATRGLGIGAEGLAALSLTNVTLLGPVTKQNAATVPAPPNANPDATATHGLVVVATPDVVLNGVEASGWATFGALFINSTVTWTNGVVARNVGVGIMVWGGSAELDVIDVQDTFRGLIPLIPGDGPAGVALANGAQVMTNNLNVSGTQGFGVFQDATAAVTHLALQGRDNDQAGLWVQSTTGTTTIDGATFFKNRLAGIAAIEAAALTLTNSSISITQPCFLPVPEHFADGVQLVGTAATIANSSIRVTDRVSVLLDLAAGQSVGDFSFSNVLVQGKDQSLGLVAQDSGGPLPLIETGVTRRGAVMFTDPEFVLSGSSLSVVGIQNPCFLPVAEDVATNGLASLL